MAFVLGVVLLILGFMVYGKIVEKIFRIQPERKTPAYAMGDGVDYIPMPTWKVFMIQLLNIAGTGPIYGAIQGALWGPAAYLWIVLGCIFGGAVHDYFSGMLSVRHNGATIADIHGIYLGNVIKQIMRVFTIIMLILCGVVFVTGPAQLLSMLTKNTAVTYTVWLVIIFVYYFLATILPIDVLIGNLYPFFGACLIIMAVGMGGGILFEGYKIPSLALANMNPGKVPIWPGLFITIACGAVSGFHGTQSPLMARCIKNEKEGRKVFYGAMIAEGIIAMVWATVAMSFYNGDYTALSKALGSIGPSGIVYTSCLTVMGVFGGIIAIIGAAICPITSGDTAFRGARLIFGDIFHVDQKNLLKRFLVAIPMFIVGIILTKVDFNIMWRYFGWSNQTLAMVTLWTASVFLYKYRGNYHWMTTIPAMFMTAVTSSYIYTQKIGFGIPYKIGNTLGVITMFVFLFCFLMFGTKYAKTIPDMPGMKNVNSEKSKTESV